MDSTVLAMLTLRRLYIPSPTSAAPRPIPSRRHATHQGNSSPFVPVIPARERLMTPIANSTGNHSTSQPLETRFPLQLLIPDHLIPLLVASSNLYITPIGFSAASVVSPTMLPSGWQHIPRERPYIRPPHPCPSHTQYCIITSYNIPPHFVTQNCVFVAYPKKPGGPPK